MKSPRALSDPHVSPEPPNFIPDGIPPSDKSSSRSTGSQKAGWTHRAGHFICKKKASTLTQENLEEFTRKQAEAEKENKRYSHSSPYYKGLTDFSKVLVREKLLERSPEAGHELNKSISPYYKGLTDFSLVINRERSPPSPSSPKRESQAGSLVSSSSRTSFSMKVQEWSNYRFFRPKEEGAPTLSYYTREALNEESLRERVSELSPPPPLPPLPRTLATQPPPSALLTPKSPPPLKQEPPHPILLEEPPSAPKRVALNTKDTSEQKEPEVCVKEPKYVWADKHKPLALKDFICNRYKATELLNMVNEDESHHFIFEGQPGVGKRTMILAMLREAFGPDKVQARDVSKTFELKGEAVNSIVVHVKESSQHIEVNLSELKGYEKHVIVELIKETNNRLPNKTKCSHDDCQAIILYEADKLSTDALLYIRWLLERFRGCNKIFFCCNDLSKLDPIKDLCSIVQLSPPSDKEILEVLEFIARKEEINLPRQLAERIVINSKNNLRQAIRSFEATWQFDSLLKEDQVIMTGWEDDIADIAKSIVEKQSPKQLYDIRRKLQNLIEHSVSPEFIFETLVVELKKNVDEPSHVQIDKMYKDYSGSDNDNKFHGCPHKRREENSNPKKKIIQQFMSIEEFIAKFMSYYKGQLAKKAQEMMAFHGQPP